MARPSDYTKEEAARICTHIACGKSLISFCRENGRDYSTVMDWLNKHKEFADDYTRAREDQGDTDVDSVADVREKMLKGEITPEMARVAIDSLKWTAGVRKPKKYGAKLEIDATVSADVKVTIGGDA